MHVHGATTQKMQRVLRFSLVATLAYVLLTFFAGVRAHSLALISESGHNVSDFLALLLSFVAVYFHTRPATDEKTFGYQRAGVLAAFLNALSLIVIAIWIGIEAIHRLSQPVSVQPRLMMIVAAAGLLMNGVIAALLWRVAHDVNIRSVFLHMLGDTLSTAAVIVGGFGILLTGRNWIDPALSLLIAGLILWTSLLHREGDAEHSAGGHAARGLHRRHTPAPGGDAGSARRSRSARLEPGLADQRHGLPRNHRRHSAVGERSHPGRNQLGAAR